MDLVVAAVSGMLIVTGAVGLIVAGIYWGIHSRPIPRAPVTSPSSTPPAA